MMKDVTNKIKRQATEQEKNVTKDSELLYIKSFYKSIRKEKQQN